MQDSLTAACIILRTTLLRKWRNWQRLRSSGLGTTRSLALREFALRVEALQRFVERERLRRVHECVGVLALESPPVDPRL